jgi:polyhydroxybutyrate depolymerase
VSLAGAGGSEPAEAAPLGPTPSPEPDSSGGAPGAGPGGGASGGDGVEGNGVGPRGEIQPLPELQPPPAAPAEGVPPAASAGMGAPAPEPCSEPSSLAAGNQELSLEHDGVERTFIVHVPRSLEPGARVPLVVDLHGLTSSAGAQAAISGWRDKADVEGFIVVHPQGLGASWNGGALCCGSSQREGVDDEGFIRALVTRLEQDACIDTSRVYATGLSNGGAMSHLLACNAADIFAATAPVSMGNGTRPCEPTRPVSVVLTRGTEDALVAFEGGIFPSAGEDFEQWAARNGCQGEPEARGELCEAFTRCEAGVEVVSCNIAAGHVLYDNAQGFSVPDTVWETFARQRLP